MDDVDLTPGVEYLDGLCNANHTFEKTLGEVIDNAFDAGATDVSIDLRKKRSITVSDNGAGCDDLSVMAALGHRKQHKSTKLGRYGLGLKEAAFWWGGILHTLAIQSTCSGVTRELRVDWGRVQKARSWKVAGALHERAAAVGDRGTSIRVEPLTKIPSDPSRTISMLGYIYAPAIKQGRTIRVAINGAERLVPKWEPPPFTERVDVEINVLGRKARVIAGIVEGANPKPGLTYWHGFRVIIENTTKGCADRSGRRRDASRVCGFVELLDGWVLAKNKDNISDAEDELFAAVYEAIEPLLLRAETASYRMEVAGLKDQAESVVNTLLGRNEPNAKARRPGTANKQGTIDPADSDRKHRRAKREQKGSTFRGTRQHAGPLTIQFVRSGPDELRAFWADASDGVVWFNQDHPWFDVIRQSSTAVATQALSAWFVAVSQPADVQQSFGGDAEKFYQAFGKATMSPVALNGEELGAPAIEFTAPGGEAE
jgi:hypothetical protein